MMQPLDHLSELASCCGLRGRRRGYKLPRNYFYSPSTSHLEPGNSWTLANPYLSPQPQPYILLTQPVIITGNPSPSHQTNTMTLFQHAQTAPTAAGTFPNLSLLGPGAHQAAAATPQQALQPNMISSQYAIYNSSAAMNTSIMAAPTQTIYESHQSNLNLDGGRSLYSTNKQQQQHQVSQMGQLLEASRPQQQERPVVTLSSEVFRQLELIEKQVDLSRDMDLIERHGIVITRALDPYSLMPHLTEDTLKRYHTHFLFSENYVIRFIEIIKRPGQTLGLYIRTVQFEYSQGRGSREGLVITKIDSDSPIYSSQVLHVGDEILSVNLVDIQGMSLDDVVIIMSIPKRLVLALRIPRDRSELLSLNLMQQQQLIRNSIEQLSRENATMLSFQQHQQQQRARSVAAAAAAATSLGFRDDQDLRQASTSGLITMHGREPGLTSTMNDHHVDELRREMSRRGLNHLDQQDLHHAQPVRVQSALQMSDLMVGGPIPISGENCQESYDGSDRPQGFNGGSNSINQWPGQSYSGNTPSLSRPTMRQNLMSQQHHPPTPHQHHHNFQHQHQRPHQPNEQRIVGQLGRQVAISKSRDDIGATCTDERNGFQDFELNSELDSLERSTLNKEKSSLVTEEGQIPSYDNNELTSGGPLAPMTSTFPRRTLPTRPNLAASPTPTAARNPIISNVRLGDTPEQSSYFSSSIDAINRELKELRRQRMALSTNEHSIDSSRADF